MDTNEREWSLVPTRRRATAWPSYGRGFAGALPPIDLQPGVLYRYVMGVDPKPKPMPQADVEGLGDSLAALLRSGQNPQTVTEVLAALDAAKTLLTQKSYVISEAGQIKASQAVDLHRDARFAITRQDSGGVGLLISTDAQDPNGFFQIAAWDPKAELFNYYMRVPPTWVWAGNSYSALQDGSRGHGCFDSHVNGSVVMKELKSPWSNWQSMKATMQFGADDPIRKDPLFVNSIGAEDLELTVRSLVARWTKARCARTVVDGQVLNARWLLRQLLTTTTINLASTDVESSVALQDGSSVELRLPTGFWLNADALLSILQIPADFQLPTVSAAIYASAVRRYNFALQEGSFRQSGDTYFAFLVPEAALEDNEVVRQTVTTGVITDRFAACALMVDFPNPVFSPRRETLLKYVAPNPRLSASGDGISGLVAQGIGTAAAQLPSISPEAEFAANWSVGTNWKTVFAQRIQNYMAAVNLRASSADGFDEYVRLSESRRRQFRKMKLNEFNLTLPTTNIPTDAPTLAMTESATVISG